MPSLSSSHALFFPLSYPLIPPPTHPSPLTPHTPHLTPLPLPDPPRALSIYIFILGSDSPEAAVTTNNLAVTLSQLGEGKEGERLLEQTGEHSAQRLRSGLGAATRLSSCSIITDTSSRSN